ncbi:HlyD family secretion protein [Flavobacterium urocaniciphilum]|uniref:HlyD family secretion protein n=1 Tax=Flavobacterium urocaniciphilum TaxID=1299341 RepID=A0A1H9DVV9_9FLAO|nr:HlyD family efflux transporter periplasmic adaptor subunit [Flavobacterium urocaniciphilum]SEQ16898.1 HlyD family secretion protein [Flavobacterium urocaniciphilum]
MTKNRNSNSQLQASNSQLQTTDFQLRSEEVQDILTKVPNWMIRWGTFLIFGIIILLLFMSWFIRYPDVVTSEIIITTNTPPEKLVAKLNGKIQAILIEDKANVKANTPLAVIENSANYQDVFRLKSVVESINLDKSEFPFEKFATAQLGEIEASFAVFQKEYIANQLLKELKPYNVETNAQGYEKKQLAERLQLLMGQKSITENELQIQKNDLNRQETLFKKGVISAQEIEKQRLIYLQAEKNYKNLLSSISQTKSSINDLNRNNQTTQINENKENTNLETNVLQSFYQLKKVIKDWELNYVFRASEDGIVSFLQIWSVNQNITAGENMFAIIPTQQNGLIGKLKATALNSGKIKENQRVNIRLANYPDKEFGIVKGKVKRISLTPDKEGNLLMDIALPNGLETSYNKKIQFQQEMRGSADIITEDLRLIERIFYQFRSMYKVE